MKSLLVVCVMAAAMCMSLVVCPGFVNCVSAVTDPFLNPTDSQVPAQDPDTYQPPVVPPEDLWEQMEPADVVKIAEDMVAQKKEKEVALILSKMEAEKAAAVLNHKDMDKYAGAAIVGAMAAQGKEQEAAAILAKMDAGKSANILMIASVNSDYVAKIIQAMSGQGKNKEAAAILGKMDAATVAIILGDKNMDKLAGGAILQAMAAGGNSKGAGLILAKMDPAKAAAILGVMDANQSNVISVIKGMVAQGKTKEAAAILGKMNPLEAADILNNMGSDKKLVGSIVGAMATNEAAAVIGKMTPAQAVDVLNTMDPAKAAGILNSNKLSNAAVTNIFAQVKKTDPAKFATMMAAFDKLDTKKADQIKLNLNGGKNVTGDWIFKPADPASIVSANDLQKYRNSKGYQLNEFLNSMKKAGLELITAGQDSAGKVTLKLKTKDGQVIFVEPVTARGSGKITFKRVENPNWS